MRQVVGTLVFAVFASGCSGSPPDSGAAADNAAQHEPPAAVARSGASASTEVAFEQFMRMGQHRYEAARYDEAIAFFAEAARMRLDDEQARRWLAMATRARGAEGGRAFVEPQCGPEIGRVTERNAQMRRAYEEGRALINSGDYEAAIVVLHDALAIAESIADSVNTEAHRRHIRARIDEAIAARDAGK